MPYTPTPFFPNITAQLKPSKLPYEIKRKEGTSGKRRKFNTPYAQKTEAESKTQIPMTACAELRGKQCAELR